MTKTALSTIGAVATLALAGCSGSTTRNLDPANLALTAKMAPAYDDGELTLYESYIGVNLPVRQPSQADLASVPKGAVGPFDHHPWVTTGDVKCQLTWTLANMDPKAKDGPESLTVEVLIDPWNEFGKYVPGITVQGDNAVPNLSGYDEAYDLPFQGGGRSSRIEHTTSFDDIDEVATDFATAINILTKVKPTPAADGGDGDDPRVGLVNHVFNLQNRTGSDPLTDGYVPPVIPALVGFNLGLRTTQKANLVIEYTIEMVDDEGNRVVEEGRHDATLQAPGRTFSLGGD
jgi:hypothetical protein